jgi:leucyl-tRNA synthetase
MSATRRLVHKTIAVVGEDLEQFRFNRAVARLRELSNHLEEVASELPGDVLREALEALVRLIAPMVPHVAAELWQLLGHETLVIDASWPEAEPDLLRDELVTIGVQHNGKLRGTIEVPANAAEETVREAALALPTLVRALEGRPVRKVIVVPNRIVNVVG